MTRKKVRASAAAGTADRGPVDRLEQTHDHTATNIPVQLVIVVTRSPDRPGYFMARLRDDPTFAWVSRQPLVDGARIHIRLGCDTKSRVEMWHEGAAEFALRSTIGLSAGLTVEESSHGPVFRSHRTASPSAVDVPPVDQNEQPAIPPPRCMARCRTVRAPQDLGPALTARAPR
jgi:hypothetical protein